jgi:GTP pyrophosphokinase
MQTPRELSRLCQAHQANDTEELLLSIGFGKVQAEDVVRCLRTPPSENGEVQVDQLNQQLKTGTFERLVRKVQRKDHGGIRVSGTDSVLVRYARCCNPVSGDAIIGFITRGRGVTVHRRECAKAFDSDPQRRVEVSWSTHSRLTRPVSLRIRTENAPGILADVSQTFSEQQINISEANCRTGKDGLACNVFTFMADDLSQLKSLMKALDKVRGVVEVERV